MNARAIRWAVALGASAIVHAAAAVALLQSPEKVEIEGGGQVEIAMLGNGFADALRAGEAFETLEPVTEADTAKPVAEPSTSAYAEPQRLVPAAAELMVEARPKPTAPAEMLVKPETVAALQPEQTAKASAAPEAISPTEEVIRATVVTTAPLAEATQPATRKPVRESSAVSPRPVSEAVRPDELISPARADRPKAVTVARVETEPARLTAKERFQAADVPVPTSRPDYTPPKKEIAKPRNQKPRQTASVSNEKPKAQRKSSAGAGGKSDADARRGSTDGSAGARAANSGKQRKSDKAGNADVSNYPGKVVAKLRRALRYPSAAKSKRLRGEVQVAFVVTGAGGVTGIRVVRSSGHDELDRAAVATVQRAAPFPRIPAGAGRNQWTFTVPLAFVR